MPQEGYPALFAINLAHLQPGLVYDPFNVQSLAPKLLHDDLGADSPCLWCCGHFFTPSSDQQLADPLSLLRLEVQA
jgi:hypothetical protein